jgi:hypothetical protein
MSKEEKELSTMSTSQVKSFNAPDETRTPPKASMEIVKFGDMSIVRMTCEPGWRWSEHMRPIAGTQSCQGTHFTYIISGHFRTVMDDGTVDGAISQLPRQDMMPWSSAMSRVSSSTSRAQAGMSKQHTTEPRSGSAR